MSNVMLKSKMILMWNGLAILDVVDEVLNANVNLDSEGDSCACCQGV